VQIITASSIFKQEQQQQQEHFEPVTAVAGNSNTGQVKMILRSRRMKHINMAVYRLQYRIVPK
jgi:hypothetical protein